jgi:hypothetical protein
MSSVSARETIMTLRRKVLTRRLIGEELAAGWETPEGGELDPDGGELGCPMYEPRLVGLGDFSFRSSLDSGAGDTLLMGTANERFGDSAGCRGSPDEVAGAEVIELGRVRPKNPLLRSFFLSLDISDSLSLDISASKTTVRFLTWEALLRGTGIRKDDREDNQRKIAG